MKLRFKELITPLALLMLTAFATVACKSSDDGTSGETAWVRMAVQTKTQISFPSAGEEGIDLTQLKMPSAGECAVTFAMDDAEPITKLYSDMAAGTELPVGKYKVTASYGQNPASAWNNAYFETSTDMMLSSSQTEVNIKLDCGLKSAFAFAKFDDKFRATFKDFSVAFSTEFNSKEPLVFNDGETKIASFKEAEKLWVVVTATKKANNKKYTYGINPVMGLKGGDLHVFHFTIQDGDAAFNVAVDNGVNVVENTVKLDPSWVDDRYTKMYLSYDQTTPVLFVSGMKSSKPYDVVVTSNLGLKHFFLDFDEEFAKELGIASVDMLNLTADQKTLVDQKIGAVLTHNAENNGYRMNLSGCKDKLQLRGGLTQYSLGVRYVDNSENTESCKMDISMIEIKTDEFNDKRVWNRFAFIPAPYIVGADVSTLMDLDFEYWIKEGDGGSWRSLGIKHDKGEHRLNGLTPGTRYQTKVTFEEFTLSECAFITHTEMQIPNNDFSQFKTETCGGARFPYLTYEFNSSWATLNAQSVDKNEVGWARSFPCVRAIDGAAEISTIGYGKNTAGVSAQIMHALTQSIEKKDKWDRTWGNYIVGKIFLGTYSVANGERHGKDFDSKPIAVKFKYKFSCKNSNGPWNMQLRLLGAEGNEIGRTEFAGSNVNQGNLVELSVPIKYNADYNSKSITNIELYFVSQTGSVAANDGNLNEIYGTHREGTANFWGTPTWKESLDSRTCGNVLTIDDVTMVYPNNPEDYQIK